VSEALDHSTTIIIPERFLRKIERRRKIVKKVTTMIAVLLSFPLFLGNLPAQIGLEYRNIEDLMVKEWFKEHVRNKRSAYKLPSDDEFLEDLWRVINLIAFETDLDPLLLISIIDVESDFRNVVGLSGELGMMQIKRETAIFVSKQFGLDEPETGWTELLWNYSLNIRYGAYYLKYLLEKCGNLRTALEHYNGGSAKKRYAQEILRLYEKFKRDLGL